MSYTYLNLAEEVLQKAQSPLSYREIWDKAVELGLDEKLNSRVDDPLLPLNAILHREVTSNVKASKFAHKGDRPRKYFLKERRARGNKRYTLLDMAEEVLKETARPLTVSEIWNQGEQKGLVKMTSVRSKNPKGTLNTALSNDVVKFGSRFVRIEESPANRFGLSGRSNKTGGQKILKRDEDDVSYEEAQLHPLLAWFVLNSSEFHGGKKIHTRTIDHTKTAGGARGFHQWMHPDMVGVYFPFDDLRKEVIDLSQEFKLNSGFQLFSFELKKSIDRSNYREYFFQAVSNSSWANEGYLVASDISGHQELRRELERLSNAFGIGIIELNTKDAGDSRVLFNARNRKELDWDTINKLHDNESFKSFTQQLLASFKSGYVVDKSQYDFPAKSLSR